MNRETLASLRDIKEAVQQQQTIALRTIRTRLDRLEAERGEIVAGIEGAMAETSVEDATRAARYRSFQKQTLDELDTKITIAARSYRNAEAELSVTFAEVRAIERLMEG